MSETQASDGFNIDIEKVSQELRVRPEILKRLIISFSKTISGKMQNLKAALDANDIAKSRAILHELKGTSGNLRVQNIYQAVDVLHVAVKLPEAAEKLQQHFIELDRCCQRFQEYIVKLEN